MKNIRFGNFAAGRTALTLAGLALLTMLAVFLVPARELQTPETGIAQTVTPPAVQGAAPASPPVPPLEGAQNPALEGQVNSLWELNVPDARVELLLSGLTYPCEFQFLSPREVIITEISGKLSRFDLDTRILTPVSGVPHTSAGIEQTGLLDVELHPDYANNHRIYLSYTIADEATGKFHLTAVATAILEGDQLHDVRQILAAEPLSWSPSNFGGALEFDDQGYLYVGIGDRSEHNFAQDTMRLQGKILRLNDDGSVPADNPFVGVKGYDARIYALGVRNPQGLHFDPVSRRLFEAEHGPMGGDEVNIIRAGANYGWPVISYGKNYPDIGVGEVGAAGTHAKGMEQPLFYYLPSIAASPITMYRGSMFPEWEGDLLVGAMRPRNISKLDLDGDVIRSEYPMLSELDDRVRDIKVANDGSIYILSQKGTLHRLYRPPFVAVEEIDKGKYIYDVVCSACHATGSYGAPNLSVLSDWKGIENQPLELIYQRAIEGYRQMPPRGLCSTCTDRHVQQTVDYMLQQIRGLKSG